MDIQQPTFDQDLSAIVSQLPPPIRAFFASGKVEIIAKNLMQKYRLHIDQGAVVEREIILLLLGLKDPAEFVKTLTEEAKLDKSTVNGIVQDVNTQIFVPLRDEMRMGPAAAPQPTKSAAAQPPHVNVQPSPSRHGSQTSLPTPPVYVPLPKFPHLQKPPPPPKGSQTSFNPAKLLEDHEEPHIEFKKASPPPNLPGAIYHPPIPKPPVPPRIVTPPPPAKPYSADPYREPIGEK